MADRINLNADMGEGYGAYAIGNDDALLKIIKSANVACGFHAGDASTMHYLAGRVREEGVSIGAHPGFNDIWGFGRRRIQMPARQLEYMIAYQIGALQAICQYHGVTVTHVKAHGALNNMAAEDEEYALAIGQAIKAVDSSLIYVAPTGSRMCEAAGKLGLRLAREGFADRQYEEDGNLTSRSIPGSVITEAARAAEQAVRIARDGEVVTRTGKTIRIEADTLCVHGDEPTAVEVGSAVRKGLEDAQIAVVPLTELNL